MTNPTLSATQTILAALWPQQTPAQWEANFVAAQLNWEDVAVRAIVLGLAPQLHHRLTTWGLKPPTPAQAKLAVTHKATAQRNEAIYAQLSLILAACQTAQLHPIALKGVHLAACYYETPALRPMNDIDLLFTPEELPTAESVLAQLGYGGKFKSAEMGAGVSKHTSTFRRPDGEQGATPNPYLSTNSDRMVEPHTSLEESWFGLKVNITPGIRERAETAVLAHHPCLVLGREDLLLHVCLHFCFHLIQGAPALVQFTDLLAITQKETVDWQLFVTRCRDYRATPYALAALTLAGKYLKTPIPPDTLQTLAAATPAPLRQRVEQLTLADILHRTQQKPLVTLGERLKRGFQDRAETAKWAQDWNGRLAIWRTLLQPGKTDTGQLLLNKLKPNHK